MCNKLWFNYLFLNRIQDLIKVLKYVNEILIIFFKKRKQLKIHVKNENLIKSIITINKNNRC